MLSSSSTLSSGKYLAKRRDRGSWSVTILGTAQNNPWSPVPRDEPEKGGDDFVTWVFIHCTPDLALLLSARKWNQVSTPSINEESEPTDQNIYLEDENCNRSKRNRPGVVVITTVSGGSLPGFRFQLLHLLAVWPWASPFTSLHLSFCICKMEIIIISHKIVKRIKRVNIISSVEVLTIRAYFYNFRNSRKKAVSSLFQNPLQSKQLMFIEHLQRARVLY